MYKLFVRPLLFLFGPESIHHFTFSILKLFSFVPGLHATFVVEHPSLERDVLGLKFKNPVGLDSQKPSVTYPATAGNQSRGGPARAAP